MALEDVQDRDGRERAATGGAGRRRRLATASARRTDKGPTNVRLHFDASGAGDLKYESCCEKLGEAISKLV